MASDLLATIRSELDARLKELRPLVREYERLDAAMESLGAAQTAPAAPVLAKARAKKTVKPAAAKKAPAPRARRAPRGSAAGAVKQAASGSSGAARKPRRTRKQAPLGRFERAILDALEHGSHTAGELVMVTAMGAKEIRGGIRRLLSDDRIVKVDRDGKTAYALPPSASKG